MQKSIWLLAFLPYLHWFGSLVNGATVLTSTSDFTRIVQPYRLNGSSLAAISVIDKERGPEIPAVLLFETGIELLSDLAQEDFWGYIPSQAWSGYHIILGMAVAKQLKDVQRSGFFFGLYFIFLLMKQEQDFRSGVFAIQYLGVPWFDIIILPTGSSGLKLAPSFAHVTQLNPPPSPITNSNNSSSQIFTSGSGGLLNTTVIKPFLARPMDELGLLIGIVDMLVTIAQPPANEAARNAESIVPFSGVNISLSVVPNHTANILRYGFVNWALAAMSAQVPDTEGQALRGQMYWDDHYLGEITMVPSDSSPSTSPLIEAFLRTSTGTATARNKRSMAQRLWDAGRG